MMKVKAKEGKREEMTVIQAKGIVATAAAVSKKTDVNNIKYRSANVWKLFTDLFDYSHRTVLVEH